MSLEFYSGKNCLCNIGSMIYIILFYAVKEDNKIVIAYKKRMLTTE